MKPESVWVLTDGRPGHISQTLGLAEALTPSPSIKCLRLRTPFRQASPFLGWAGGWALAPGSASIEAPWPDLVVTSGRSAIPVALAIKRASHGQTKLVNVQDPGYRRRHFDLIVAPEHDELAGPNVMSTIGALGRVTPERLAQEGARFADGLSVLPQPRIAVLIGGANAVYSTPPAVSQRLGAALERLAAQGVGLMVTFSRRTGAEMEAAVRKALNGRDAVIWNGIGDNPYFAYLAFADHIVATEDSASMISEAATTGKPVSVATLEGGSAKFTRFHEAMRARGITRPFDGRLESWGYAPIDETARAAEQVRRLFQPGNLEPL